MTTLLKLLRCRMGMTDQNYHGNHFITKDYIYRLSHYLMAKGREMLCYSNPSRVGTRRVYFVLVVINGVLLGIVF